MSLEDEFTRDTRAMERIASALEDWVKLQRERFQKEFPAPKVKRDAEIIRADDSVRDRGEQYSDKASEEWVEETENALPSRFSKRFDGDKDGKDGTQETASKRGRATPVSKGDANNSKPS